MPFLRCLAQGVSLKGNHCAGVCIRAVTIQQIVTLHIARGYIAVLQYDVIIVKPVTGRVSTRSVYVLKLQGYLP